MTAYRGHVDILHIIGAFIAGGAEHFVVDLLGALKDRGLTVGLFVLSSRSDRVGLTYRERLDNKSIPYWCGPTAKIGCYSLFSYIRNLFLIKPNIVHLHTPNTEFTHFLAKSIYRRKHLIYRTIHSTTKPENLLHWMAIRKNPVSMSIACGFAVEDAYMKEIKGEIITIENGIFFDWPIQTKEICREARERLGISNKAKHFINVGRQEGTALEKSPKGQDTLIKAWVSGKLGKHGCVLHLIGDGNLQEQLKLLAKGDTSIHFHGTRKDVVDWLLAGDCFVMTSRFEGLPVAGIEAIGTGLPCLFCDIKPLRELNAPVALWSGVDNVEALKFNLIEMVYKRKIVQYKSILEFREKYGMNKTANMYYDCYNRGKSKGE